MVVSATWRMQALDILPDRIVQPQLRCSRSFMIPAAVKLFECDAIRNRWRGVSFSPVARLACPNANSRDDLAAMRDGDDAAGPLRCTHLEFDPAAECSRSRAAAMVPRARSPKCRMSAAIDDGPTSRRECCRMLSDKTKPAQPYGLRRLIEASRGSVNQARCRAAVRAPRPANDIPRCRCRSRPRSGSGDTAPGSRLPCSTCHRP